MAKKYASLDEILLNLVKPNAALLELVAYGSAVYPQPQEFEREHRNFALNVRNAFNGANCLVISAIEDKNRRLDILGTFDGGEPVHEPRPAEDLFKWLVQTARKKTGILGQEIDKWLEKHDQKASQQIYIVPYVVTPAFGASVLPADVPRNFETLRDDPALLNRFIDTAPIPFLKALQPVEDGYFRAYACLGLRNDDVDDFPGDLSALLQTLMIFYQMSWGNLSIIKTSEERQQRSRERQSALAYNRMRDPVEKLVEQLRAAQQPLNRLQAVLSPVRGLFASRLVGEKFFASGQQNFNVSNKEYSTQICHDFGEFGAMRDLSGKEQIRLAAEQVAAVLLEGFDELKTARTPLWEYLRYTLRFGDAYRRVAEVLLEKYSALLEHGLVNFRDDKEQEYLRGELGGLFALAKYWFFEAGRLNRPMRADYLTAGLSLLFPEDSGGAVVDMKGLKDDTRFWVSSELPVYMLPGLEALCREYGDLASARLELTPDGDNQMVSLSLRFSGKSAEEVAKTDLGAILANCRAYQEERSITRGNMVFAIMQFFGEVPQWGGENPEPKEEDKRIFYRDITPRRASLAFGDRQIQAKWISPAIVE